MDAFDLLDDPLAMQRAASAYVRKNPALGMPSSGVETPKPEPPMNAPEVSVNGSPTQSYKTLMQINERMNQQPDPSQLIGLAQERGDRSNRNMLLGLALQAKGGQRLGGAGGQILQRALADSGDVEIPGGWGTVSREGKVAWNPAKQQEADLARLTQLYGIQERGERADEAAQQRSEDVRYRTDAAKQAAADRLAAQQGLAADRADARRERDDYRKSQDNERQEYQQQVRYENTTRDTARVLDTARYVKSLPADGKLNALQQQSLMILLNKFQDPGSVVREGEFDRVAAAQGILQKWGNLPEKIQSGKPLPPEMVRDLLKVVGDFTAAAESTMYWHAAKAKAYADSAGLRPERIVVDTRWLEQPERPGGGAAPTNTGANPEGSVRLRNAPATPARRKDDVAPDVPPPGAVRRRN